MRFATTAASLMTLMAHASLALALAPLGPAFQVNSTTTGNQGDGGYTSCGYWKQRQHGIGSGGGQFVVVWESRYHNGSEYAVFGQRYDATATPLGGEFEVHASTGGTQTMPVVAQAASGQFVVAWGSSQFYDYPMDIFARAFDSSGTPLGPAFQVSENGYDLGGYPAYHYGKVENPAIEADASGKFVVVWSREDASADGKDIMGRRLDASGTPLAGAFQASEQTSYPDSLRLRPGEGDQSRPADRAAHVPDHHGTGAGDERQVLVGAVRQLHQEERDRLLLRAQQLTSRCAIRALCYPSSHG